MARTDAASRREQADHRSDLVLFGSRRIRCPRRRLRFLVLKGTREANVGSSAYHITSLARTLRHRGVRRARRVIILDCCFAASAYSAFQSPILDVVTKQSIEALATHGTALLCASAPDRPAKSRTKAGATASGMTLFSESLVFALENGQASIRRDRLTLAEIASVVEDLMLERFTGEGPRPQVKFPDERDGDVSKVPFSPKPGFYARGHCRPSKSSRSSTSHRFGNAIPLESHTWIAAPIVVAIEHADEPIQSRELLQAERHLTVRPFDRAGQRATAGIGMRPVRAGTLHTETSSSDDRHGRFCIPRRRGSSAPSRAFAVRKCRNRLAGRDPPLLFRSTRPSGRRLQCDMDSKNLLGVGDHYFGYRPHSDWRGESNSGSLVSRRWPW